MLNKTLRDEIRTMAQEFWNAEVQTPQFAKLAAGKEIGHRIADKVDEQTTQLLRGKYPIFFEHGPKGQRARSMGDFWLLSEGNYHPVNVKAGQENSNGQPNIVSLKKLLRALLTQRIDSYYLLIVKFQISTAIRATVYFIDILDYIDCVTFNSGPGQMMLKEKQFYTVMRQSPREPSLSLHQKREALVTMLENGEVSLIKNRAKTLDEIRSLWAEYLSGAESGIEPAVLNQIQWNLHEPG